MIDDSFNLITELRLLTIYLNGLELLEKCTVIEFIKRKSK